MRTGIDGFTLLPDHLDRAAQAQLLSLVDDITAVAPFDRYVMPGSGRPFSIDMTNAGPLGWVADKSGYRYSPTHLKTGQPWPPIPDPLLSLWREVAGYRADPECCLVNLYRGPAAKLGLHRDEDEQDPDAPILNVSLGDTAIFRLGGATRKDPTRSFTVSSGTVMLFSGPARHAYHGIDRILPGSSTLVPGGGRVNLTLRRVTPPVPSPQGACAFTQFQQAFGSTA
ncbi:alpha-ketoglutarate-dependent dioxygenase AlkB [Aerophototrophica crusticola]|uniref:Alpha-ketoglutarate-dependent dioxygenase AlkB n=1 Tax=Aerophototrophica crusticola TaxID=1709002 RepID=A0A858RAT3_9PROT|nr:alpha-ketoglutarate-dependent dioxygenase AlkB [Rhodospirillaceae bacterium B3]